MVKLLLPLVLCLLFVNGIIAQDVATPLKEADNLEKGFNEPEALEKFKAVLVTDAVNMKALTKAAELSCNAGARAESKVEKRLQYESALSFANRAFAIDSNNADANLALSIVNTKLADIETDAKKAVINIRNAKVFADKAVTINPLLAKAIYAMGKWHYDMFTQSAIKKLTSKVVGNGLPAGNLDSAIIYFEKCKIVDPYYIPNFYFLNKAYKESNKPAKQLEVLSKLIKLPIRSFDDTALKAEAEKQLQDLQ